MYLLILLFLPLLAFAEEWSFLANASGEIEAILAPDGSTLARFADQEAFLSDGRRLRCIREGGTIRFECFDETGLLWSQNAEEALEEEVEYLFDPWIGFERVKIEVPITEELPRQISCKALINNSQIDCTLICGFWHALQLTSKERKAGQFNLFDHLDELLPHEGNSIGLISWQNGIMTRFETFEQISSILAEKIPEGTLFIGLHNRTRGFGRDLLRACMEILALESGITAKTRIFFTQLAAKVHKINPDLIWAHILYSEAGAIIRSAIEGMSEPEKTLLKRHLYLFGVAPALPIPRSYAYKAINVYSEHDFAALATYFLGISGYTYAKLLSKTSGCHIEFLRNESTPEQKILFLFDHILLAGTYAAALDEQFNFWREKYSFYRADL